MQAQNLSSSRHSWLVTFETADLEMSSSPVASMNASSTSRVDSPRGYLSVTRPPSIFGLPS